MSCVYILENTINNKKYIGQTNRTINKRIIEHKHQRTLLGRDIIKYGLDNFKISYTTIENEELDILEKMLIDYMNTYQPNGYNIVGGGNKGKYIPKKTRAKISKSIKSIMNDEYKEKISNARKLYYKNNPDAVSGKNNGMYGRRHKQSSIMLMKLNTHTPKGCNNPMARKIRCIETGEIFGCIKDAADKYNIFTTSIIRVCKNKQKTSGGYRWEYIGDKK